MAPANPPSLSAATVRHLRELGGEALLQRLVTLLLELTPQRLAALAGALESGDLVAARHAAHALCSTAGTLGASSLLAAAQGVEAAGELPATRAAAAALEMEWSRLGEPLSRWLEETMTPGGQEGES